jgi:hypothetical protein
VNIFLHGVTPLESQATRSGCACGQATATGSRSAGGVCHFRGGFGKLGVGISTARSCSDKLRILFT